MSGMFPNYCNGFPTAKLSTLHETPGRWRCPRQMAVWFVIAQYRWTARLHLRYQGLPNYRLFRYEDLLAAPEQTLRQVCQFVETDFTEDMLNPEKGAHEHQRSSITGKQQRAFDVTAAIRWQTVISPMD